MSPTSKRQLTDTIRQRYLKASKPEKKSILDEFCAVCLYNRKYAIRLLNSNPNHKPPSKVSNRGRKKKYHHPLILQVLRDIWVATNLPCSKRLKVILPLWLPHYEFEIPNHVNQALLNISPATIDRIMQLQRSRFKKQGLSSTKPGTLIKKRIPIKTNQWNEKMPGFLEADTVAHCGTSTAGMFVYTVNIVDLATTWTEQRAVWGKGEKGVIEAIKSIENSLPFLIKGFDCDNGSEFLNWHLVRHLTNRKKPVAFTRSRAYHKNDNAHIEEKNWTNIRQYLGYFRFELPILVEKLNELYTTEWNRYFNFFIPSVKLINKFRNGGRLIKVHDKPKTPLQRILDSEHIEETTKQKLTAEFETLNPFSLQKQMMKKLKEIIKIAINQRNINNSYP